jgi:hypothetical protein
MVTSGDDLQSIAYHPSLKARKYKMNISSTETKSIVACGKYIQTVKISNMLALSKEYQIWLPRIPYIGCKRDFEGKLPT